jgi:hypothetical protein
MISLLVLPVDIGMALFVYAVDVSGVELGAHLTFQHLSR